MLPQNSHGIDSHKLEALSQQMKKDEEKRRQSNTKYKRMMVSACSTSTPISKQMPKIQCTVRVLYMVNVHVQCIKYVHVHVCV